MPYAQPEPPPACKECHGLGHALFKIIARYRKWHVVIPSRETSNLRHAVKSILDTHPGIDPKRIICVDDGARSAWNPTDPAIQWVQGAKPFVFARNVNIGMRAAGEDDVIIMGDDVEVRTPMSFDIISDTTTSVPQAGLVATAVSGPCGNPWQHWRQGDKSILDGSVELVFICVYVPRSVIKLVGELDEQFVGYGMEDLDLSWRVKNRGLKLLVDQRTRVIHNKPGMPSSWRSRPDMQAQWKHNIELFKKKWNLTKYP